jgi:hypothetical protein
MTVNISYFAGAGWQFFDNSGVILSGGLIYTYSAGTTTPAATYTSNTGLTLNANPIVLNSAGRTANEIWLTAGNEYKFILKTSTGVTIGTYDNIPGVGDQSYVDAQIADVYAAFANTVDVAKGDALVGFAQSNSSGVLSGAVAKTVHQKFQEMVSVKDFGAVGDSSTDDTTAIQACATYCFANNITMYIPAGTYKITTAITAQCSIRGDGPKVSIIKNYGTGDALDLSGSNYYTTFQNFAIDGSGNASSRDGISLYNTTTNTGNPAYCFFFAVHSNNNGRHGLYHRYAWATRYSQCMFTYNAGLGVYDDTRLTDAGTANCVTFIQCDSRHNGGTNSGFGSDFGGVKVKGAQGFSWIGGVIESNNGYGVYVGDAPGGVATRLVHFKECYFEYNGYNVADGANFYVTGPWANFVVEDCWIAHGATTGNTNTVYFLTTSLDGGNFVERNNTLNNVGTGGTNNIYGGTHLALPRLAVGSAPTVYAYQNAATILTVADSTFTKIPLDVEAWDSNNNYDTTLFRFTPTVAGYYRINARANYFPSGGTNFFVSIFQNGSEIYRGTNVINSGASAGAGVDCMVYANGSTDYFEFYVFQASGSPQNYNPGFALCGMQIDYARNP